MEGFAQSINFIAALGTIAGQVSVVLAALLWFFSHAGSDVLKQKSTALIQNIKPSLLPFAFIVALSATLTSLLYSNIIGFSPCTLCWVQRIFLYPQVVILALALWKKTRDANIYCIALSSLGAAVALYHYYGEMFNPSALDACTAGIGISCAVRYVFEFGYVTIPLMSLTAFLLIITALLIATKRG